MRLKDYNKRVSSFQLKYESTCSELFHEKEGDSIWLIRPAKNKELPPQGFKLHISATIFNAEIVLRRCAPYLIKHGITFKAAKSLTELKRLNCGLYYGPTQIGKFITVYPVSIKEAMETARQLHHLTKDLKTIDISHDLPFSSKGSVFYRYGAFRQDYSIKTRSGHVDAIKRFDGVLVKDNRAKAIPNWITNPMPEIRQNITLKQHVMFKKYRIFHCLSQRGKGGVYRALDFTSTKLVERIVKEGKKNGEIDFDGRDGYKRVKHEFKMLCFLIKKGIPVPDIKSSFTSSNNFYIVMEKIEGESIQSKLIRSTRKTGFIKFHNWALQIVQILTAIHKSGVAWRDCKPLNLIINKQHIIRPIDFEGACFLDKIDEIPWGSEGYLPPDYMNVNKKHFNPVKDDLYALGATFFHIITGSPLIKYEQKDRLLKVRRGYPKSILTLILRLLNTEADSRPTLTEIHNTLLAAQAILKNQEC